MRRTPLRFEGNSGKATRDREVEGADDLHAEAKAKVERKIERAMLKYWRELQKRIMAQMRKQGKSLE